MDPLAPKVTLLSYTANPVETIYAIWEASRHNGQIHQVTDYAQQRRVTGLTRDQMRRAQTHEDLCACATCVGMESMDAAEHAQLQKDFEAADKIYETFKKVIDSKIPVAENVTFTFLLENVSIAFREQMVRHRIGVKVGDRLGCDLAPDLADSTWWAQSMRILDMGKFVEEGRYDVPATIDERPTDLTTYTPGGVEKPLNAREAFIAALKVCQNTYKELVRVGIPMEDAREIIPLSATSRITWTLNLAALQHIIGKRGCWILQLGFWGPIIKGMVDQLAERVDPYFRNLIAPPCISGDKFKACLFKLDNERRIDGEDEIPPCPMFLHNHQKEAVEAARRAPDAKWVPITIDGKQAVHYEGADLVWMHKDLADNHPRMLRMMDEYKELWKRNVYTGDPLANAT